MKVSFDFDSTLSRQVVQNYAQELINRGIEVWICTSRWDDKTAFERQGYTDYNQDLFLVAPKHHFDLTGLLFDENKGYFKAEVQVFKDPIVFRYAKGNMVQVVTKWGLEADDPALQMEILN